jgi:hypothetical protein
LLTRSPADPVIDWPVERYELIVFDQDTPGAFTQSVGTKGTSARIDGLKLGHKYVVVVATWTDVGGGFLLLTKMSSCSLHDKLSAITLIRKIYTLSRIPDITGLNTVRRALFQLIRVPVFLKEKVRDDRWRRVDIGILDQ